MVTIGEGGYDDSELRGHSCYLEACSMREGWLRSLVSWWRKRRAKGGR